MTKWTIAFAIMVGIAAGIGGYTFRYAKGLSYFSTDPSACVNCHIMQPQYDAWQKSSHHTVAVCVDCHLPHAFVPKYLAKAENGWRHGQKFTTQRFDEPIVVQAAGREILQNNCVHCHDQLVHDIASGPRAELDQLDCVHCHAGVGHGQRASLGPPLPRHP
jgi:cytochrome c nitrite reductase small subunit